MPFWKHSRMLPSTISNSFLWDLVENILFNLSTSIQTVVIVIA